MGEHDGSITHWLGDLRGGDLAAAQPLWERDFGKLVVLARSKLQRQRQPRVEADEEDAAPWRIQQLCVGVAEGKFPQLADREDLWRILMTITVRKAYAQVQRQKRLKSGRRASCRGGRASKGEERVARSTLFRPGLELVAGDEPSPEFAAMVAEEYRRLLDALEDDGLRQVAVSRMEGYTCDEIAVQLGCARRTVARRLDLIRKTWLAHGESALMAETPPTKDRNSSLDQRGASTRLASDSRPTGEAGAQPRIEDVLIGSAEDRGPLFQELLALEIELRNDRRRSPLPSRVLRPDFPT